MQDRAETRPGAEIGATAKKVAAAVSALREARAALTIRLEGQHIQIALEERTGQTPVLSAWTPGGRDEVGIHLRTIQVDGESERRVYERIQSLELSIKPVGSQDSNEWRGTVCLE